MVVGVQYIFTRPEVSHTEISIFTSRAYIDRCSGEINYMVKICSDCEGCMNDQQNEWNRDGNNTLNINVDQLKESTGIPGGKNGTVS